MKIIKNMKIMKNMKKIKINYIEAGAKILEEGLS